MPAATQAGVFGIGGLPSRRSGPQIGLQVARRDAHKDAERVVGLTEQDLECGDGRAGLLQDGPRLLDVEPCRRADAEFLGRQGQHAFLNPDVVARDLDSLLGDAILHVIRGHVGEQGHERGVVVFHRCIESWHWTTRCSGGCGPTDQAPSSG